MAQRSITTEHDVTVTVTSTDLVVLDHPDAPDDMRHIEVGRLTHCGEGFQPVPLFPGAMRPDVLRAIADLIESIKEGK